jgi:hypothetical protein
VVRFTPLTLYSRGKSPLYPLDRTLVGSQSWCGRGGEEENSLGVGPFLVTCRGCGLGVPVSYIQQYKSRTEKQNDKASLWERSLTRCPLYKSKVPPSSDRFKSGSVAAQVG